MTRNIKTGPQCSQIWDSIHDGLASNEAWWADVFCISRVILNDSYNQFNYVQWFLRFTWMLNSEDTAECVLYCRPLQVSKYRDHCCLCIATLCCLISSPIDKSRLNITCDVDQDTRNTELKNVMLQEPLTSLGTSTKRCTLHVVNLDTRMWIWNTKSFRADF